MHSTLRLFLSVDVAGSTALKELINYQSLEDRLTLTDRIVSDLNLSERVEDLIAKGLLVSEEEFDWARVLQDAFTEFHAAFQEKIREHVSDPWERYPWKALGDELIYSFRLRSRDQAAKLITAFLEVLRQWDNKLADGNQIRMKGCAWTAGFPVRNREVELPMPRAFFRDDATGPDVEFPYPRRDYWGPDMDVGFRLGKASFPGMCVASLDLIDLLTDHQSNSQLRAKHVGWELLKGVWGGRPYPVFWLELPAEFEDAAHKPTIRPWAEAESSFVKAWRSGAAQEVKLLRDRVREIRDNLPGQFGVVQPYIVDAGDKICDSHKRLLELIEKLKKRPTGQEAQGIDVGANANAGSVAAAESQIEAAIRMVGPDSK